MHAACERLKTDVVKADTTWAHDGCEITAGHVRNARAAARPGGRYVLTKASPTQKIDACVTSVLAHEAAGDVIAAGLAKRKKNYVYTA
jgi:phage terminase large subunit-like protein